jgi:antitoxin ParD1/3/4
MPKVVKRTFSLTEEQAKFIDSKVAQGAFASGSEVVREGLREMQEDQAILDDWLTREVLPAIKELEEHPERARPADEVFAELKSEFRKKHMPSRKRA